MHRKVAGVHKYLVYGGIYIGVFEKSRAYYFGYRFENACGDRHEVVRRHPLYLFAKGAEARYEVGDLRISVIARPRALNKIVLVRVVHDHELGLVEHIVLAEYVAHAVGRDRLAHEPFVCIIVHNNAPCRSGRSSPLRLFVLCLSQRLQRIIPR